MAPAHEMVPTHHPFGGVAALAECIVDWPSIDTRIAWLAQVHVRVNIPTRPSKDEIQLVEKLREAQVESAKRPRIGKWQF